LLREAFGPAGELVTYIEASELYTRPEAAMATLDAIVRRSAETLDSGLRIYGEIPACSTQAEWNAWITYEAAVERAFAQRPVALFCGYDARVMPAGAIELAWQTHRAVHAGIWQVSPEYREPEELARSLAPPFETLQHLRSLTVAEGRLQERLAEELAAAAVPAERADDLLVAAREVLANAELYGNGVRTLRVGRVGERFVCEVGDSGSGLEDPLAGYLPPDPLAPHGAGLWVARQLTSRLDLHSAPDGLTVRLWA
jgi:anti-sigma regulatory factor (Ser/Thr protein kinase)